MNIDSNNEWISQILKYTDTTFDSNITLIIQETSRYIHI